MFGHMIRTFVQAFFLAFPIMIAFALAFYMAFYSPELESSPFFNPFLTSLTVLSYSFGGADYNGLFALSHEGETNLEPLPFPTVSIILWVLFLIMMLILLVNMLVSLD